MDRNYGGVIWTNHAMDRMRERGIKQGDAWATWNRPEQSKKGSSGNWVYYRNWGGTQIEVVAKQNEKKEWIILSVWSKPTGNFSQATVKPKGKVTFWRWLYNLFFS